MEIDYKKIVRIINTIIVKNGLEGDLEKLTTADIVSRELAYAKEARELLKKFELELFELGSTLTRANENDNELYWLEDQKRGTEKEIRDLEHVECFHPSDFAKGALAMAEYIYEAGQNPSDMLRIGRLTIL
jgi:cob(I)alamin adenosyltransferase